MVHVLRPSADALVGLAAERLFTVREGASERARERERERERSPKQGRTRAVGLRFFVVRVISSFILS